MCGLVGVIGDTWGNDKKMFGNLLELDTTRGPHSTGVAEVNYSNKLKVNKWVGTPWHHPEKFASKRNYLDGGAGLPKLMLGHNRWATVGEITEDNAHPFHVGSLIGAHNGTLSDWGLKQLEDYNLFDVDSEALFFNIQKNGVKDTISKTEGAWALTMYDEEKKEFYLLRNNKRPLFFAFHEKRNTMYWASEEWMLICAAHRSDIKLKDIQEVPVDTLLTFKFDNIKDPLINFTKEEGVKGTSKPYQNFQAYTGYRGTYGYGKEEKREENVTKKPHSYNRQIIGVDEDLMIISDTVHYDEKEIPYIKCTVDDGEYQREGRIYLDTLDDDDVSTLLTCEFYYSAYVLPETIYRDFFVVKPETLEGPFEWGTGEIWSDLAAYKAEGAKTVAICDYCGSDILHGEDYYKGGGNKFCLDCGEQQEIAMLTSNLTLIKGEQK